MKGLFTTSTLLPALVTAGCGIGSSSGDPGPDAGSDDCRIGAEYEPTPGFPDGYDLASFRDDVVPALASKCGAPGCHHPASGAGDFRIWEEGREGGCDLARTFNNFRTFTDPQLAANSPILLAIDGAYSEHPVSVPAGTLDGAILEQLRSLIRDAIERTPSGSQAPGGSPLDYERFQDEIMPMLDGAGGAGCTTGGCHDRETNAGGFGLHREPEQGSTEMEDNFERIAERVALSEPARSAIYVRSTEPHAAGNSVVIEDAEAETMLAWIEEGAVAAGESEETGCADVSGFNLGVWEDDIMPILTGDYDANVGGAGSGPMCTAGPCHGTERVAEDGETGKLYLDPEREPRKNLESFACFVNITNPVRSEILLCPLDRAGCRHRPHPGEDIFEDTNDLNYQRLLSFIYSGNPQGSPLDFAFFASRINPIFDNPAASESGRTCTGQNCHGVLSPGDEPPNASNFPILPNAKDPDQLTVNFTNAAAFTSFLTPEESSLFLYPTNEIQERFGFSHVGGQAFEADSAFAEDILTWARGLRPDGQGFNRNWLVAGDYIGPTEVRDETALTLGRDLDEETIRPRVFDESRGQRDDAWEGFFADGDVIDLNEAFPRDTSPGRSAFAVAYVMNTTSRPLETTLRVESPHEVLLYFGDLSQPSSEGAASLTRELPPYKEDDDLVRIMIKAFQAEDEPGAGFEFTARFRDDRGDPLSDEGGELVFVLGPEGGI